VLDEEAGTDQLAAVAVVNLGPHDIDKAHLLTTKFAERQLQAALPLVAGVIDGDGEAAAVLAGPG
jgi:hypothetical protein